MLAIRGFLAAGLAAGGLVSPASGFELPVPSTVLVAPGNGSVLPPVISGNTMTVRQLSDKATLDWQSFNIGAENTVRFDQPQSTSVALNRIHQADPSQIQGRLTANGQVYLVNQNGFVFGSGSQVDANTLVVSALDITDSALAQGLTKVVDSSPSSGPVAALSGDGHAYRIGAGGGLERIAIRLEPGARLSTNASNGRILLAAPSIQNQGQIQAADGQVILAAATDKVYLQEADPDSDLRGILVEVKTGGDINNLGKVLAQRGNATLIGFAIRQQGEVSASTSVALNGSVRLLAREGAALQQVNGAYKLVPQSTLRGADSGDGLGSRATVALGPGSRTAVDLDVSGGTAVDEQTQPRSKIDIEAGLILLQGGSQIQAHGGTVNLTASENPANPMASTSADNGSRIWMDAGSRIDVSGTTDTVVPMERNIVSIQLLSNELRDAPIQKSGPLYGKTVQVDARAADKNGHIPIADVSGAIARIQRSVGERNAQGGSVKLSSEGDVVLNPGAKIDLSGGLIHYLGGLVKTTLLMDANGRIHDIDKASPDLSYLQIFGKWSKTWKTWNQTETWDLTGPLGKGVRAPAYDEGRNAGSLTIQSREVLMEAEILSRTVDGILQRQSAKRPDGGSLAIQTAWSGQQQQDVQFKPNPAKTALAQDAAFPRTVGLTGPAALELGNSVFANGLRHLSVDSIGKVSIDPGLTLTVPANGSLSLAGGEIDVQGSVSAPAGQLSLQTQPATGNSASLSGAIRLAAETSLDVSGQWINDVPYYGKSPSTAPLPIYGGSVSLFAQGDLILPAGSKITADGGAWVNALGQAGQGKGGNITLKVAKPNETSKLVLGADISSFALSQGGTLDITANAIRLTQGSASLSPDSLALAPDLLENHGFSQINLTANAGSLAIDPGLTLRLRALNLAPNGPVKISRSSLPAFSPPGVAELPLFERQPVKLSLAVKQSSSVGAYVQDRGIVLGEGAAIAADPGARISLSSDANIRVNGVIDAPSGQIDASLLPPNYTPLPDYNPDQAIAIGPQARLSTVGVEVLQPNFADLNLGQVLPGGQITMQAARGYILMGQGASMDVSGTAYGLDWFQSGGSRIGDFYRQTVASAAGGITLAAAEGIVLDGQIYGKAGGSDVAGGSLSLELNAQLRAEPRSDSGAISPNFPSSPRIVHLSQQATPKLAADWFATGQVPVGLNGQAYLGVNQVEPGGFSELNLKSSVIVPKSLGSFANGPETGAIQLDGNLNLTAARRITLDAPLLAWNGEAGNAVLDSAYIALGSLWNRQTPGLASLGEGNIAFHAGWIDLVGAMETQGIRSISLLSSADIRLIGVNPNQEKDLLGEFATAGDLTLAAHQVYPGTLSQFNIKLDAALNPDGKVTITGGGETAKVPLSAGGILSIEAPYIESQGVLRAPFGEIDLAAAKSLILGPGSLTSTSAGSPLIPFGRTQAGLDWVFPVGAYTRIIASPPAQAIHLSAPGISFQSGAKIDVSGGGDLSAFEFIPGPGGSVDVLDPKDPGYLDGSHTYQTQYAILPALGSPVAPYDPIEFPASGLRMGDGIYLSGGSGLAAGYYTLLPAHYALLPGAFLVTPQAGYTNSQAGRPAQRLDGTPIVAGYRYSTGTAERDSLWSGFAVEPGSIALTRSEYRQTTASQFFPQQAIAKGAALPLLPADAGAISIAVSQFLSLEGSLNAQGFNGGRGARLDISADKLAIAPNQQGSAQTPAGTVLLSAEELNRLAVESLLLGGRRSESSGAMTVSVDAQTLTLLPGAALQGPEILLAAKDTLSLEDGSSVNARGTLQSAGSRLQLSGKEALARVSSGSPVAVNRQFDATDTAAGNLSVAKGAVLGSGGSIYLDATGDWRLNGEIAMEQGSLGLVASRISFGDAPADTPGLVLSSQMLGPIHAGQLLLGSHSSLDLYGDLDFQTRSLSISAAGINGYGQADQTARFSADSIVLENPLAYQTSDPSPGGAGSLRLEGRTLVLGAGDFSVQGFAQIQLSAADAIVGQGAGRFHLGGDAQLQAGKLTAAAGADTLLDAGAHDITLTCLPGGNPSGIAAGLGAKLTIQGGDILQQGVIELPAGNLTLQAKGNLSLADGALVDVAGRAVDLGETILFAPGGSVNLAAGGGKLSLAAGAIIDVSGSGHGGDAGSVSLQAPFGGMDLGGSFKGQAQAGFKGGRFGLDVGTLTKGLTALNQSLQAGGFTDALSLRLREGDWLIGPDETLKAGSIAITADSGSLTVRGSLDASGPSAGQIRLAAGDVLGVEGSARLLATASAAGQGGGTVVLESVDADGDGLSGVTVQNGAAIQVSGGVEGSGGTVAVRVARTGTDDAAVALAPGVVEGAAKQTVEAVKTYPATALSNAQVGQWRQETSAYMALAALNTGLQNRLGGFTLVPGLDIQSTGDLNLNLSEKLNGNAWTKVQQGSNIYYYTQMDDLAGAIGALQQTSPSGTVQALSAATSGNLAADGTYYFDTDPNSATFRRLLVRVFPENTLGANRYDPSKIKASLVESNAWDFLFPSATGQVWRFGSGLVPGVLTLQAAGNLTIQQNLTDGFAVYNASQLALFYGVSTANWLNTLMLQPGDSWSYRLVAGANLASADPLAVKTDAASLGLGLTLGKSTSVRTGTGSIDVASSGDIKLTDQTSTLFTAGRPTDSQRYGSLSKQTVVQSFNAEYPIDGGSISLAAGRDIIGAASSQFMSDWLIRTGNWSPADGTVGDSPTAWGIAFDGIVVQNSANSKIQNLKFGFQENIGALGGGDVSVKAGRNIQDLSVMMPGTAKPIGSAGQNIWDLQGGGNLTAQSGGDILGGVFFVDKGGVDIRAGGSILGGSQYTAGPVFALGDAQFHVNALGDINIGAAVNPYLLTQAKFTDKPAYFTTYTDASLLNLQAIAGDIHFNNNLNLIRQQYKIFDAQSPKGRSILASFDLPLLGVYPGSLQAYALSGAMDFGASFSLYPSAQGDLALMAAGNISTQDGPVSINQSDLDPASLLNPAAPAQSLNLPSNGQTVNRLYGSDPIPARLHAASPLHAHDPNPVRLVSAQGSILAGQGLLLTTAEPVAVYAGFDITGLGLSAQNILDEAVSSVMAGRDILYPIQRDPVTRDVRGSGQSIQLSGPGQLRVLAGRDIDLGSSDGIRSVGKLLNPALHEGGADLLLLAGLGSPKPFLALPQAEVDDLFGQLREAITEAAKAIDVGDEAAKAAAYRKGYGAIADLFPGANYQGDIALFFSTIQTVDGGTIQLLAPGGLVNAGLPVAFTGNKTADQLGIVAQRQGDIDIFVNGDLQVNRSRVSTLDGGDITVWSSYGSIDAGRGAKSALSAPLPITSFDAQGNLVVSFPPTVSGSGIRAQSGSGSGKKGNVYLAAPQGHIDFNEAGSEGDNLITAAPLVLNQANANFSGQSTGLPQAPSYTPPPANVGNGLAAVTDAAVATLQSQDATQQAIKQKQAQPARLDSILSAQVLGFGNCSVSDVKAGKLGCGD